ncbi:hypothetical protein [Caballeronia sp. ATUFL_F1_KS39]|uniref:hypothetical protein n=1 Tax=Caballeronia sp. ATUFL_F1_KS39 TaxID=2921766 RepID=UPI0020294739|nr:hypothetical protein [Caballeronia sp. ATUFL_F1_KS39]
MTRAVSEHWIERLFSRMESIYGARFHDFWRNVEDLNKTKKIWREGLADMTDLDLRRGVAALFHTRSVPDLPAFRELCRPVPKQFETPMIPPHSCLTDQRPTITPEGIAQLAYIKTIVADTFEQARPDGIEWARRLPANAKEGQAINAVQIEFAEDAIRRWEMTHHQAERDDDQPDELPPRVPSPHIYGDREPGSDDEELAS